MLWGMATSDRPNIVLFVGEDTGRHQGCYGDTYARTPNIDRLAAEGCRFANAFSTAPVCAPSRSAMITGQYASKMGSHHMRSTLIDPPKLFTEELREGGYFVNWANKTDFNFEPPESFTDVASEWVDELEQGQVPQQPFLLYYNFGPTHESRMWPPGAEPGAEPPAPEPGEDAALYEGLPVPPYLPDTPTTRASLVRYYQRLEEQDAMLGRVLDGLEQNGLADQTIVLYFTDHGRGLCREKRWLYEAGFHLPLIARGPGIDAGTIREDLVSWVDIAPTLHALAGLDVPERYDGRVFLGPDTQPEPPCVFAARDRMDECFDRVRAARDRRYLYLRNDFPHLPWAQRLRYMETSPVTREMRQLHAKGELPFPADRYMQPVKPSEELYDTVDDPHCVFNLADRPDHAHVLDRLRQQVRQWTARIGDRGYVSEQQLIDDGVITDRLHAEYAPRVGTLPEPLRGDGVYDTTLIEP